MAVPALAPAVEVSTPTASAVLLAPAARLVNEPPLLVAAPVFGAEARVQALPGSRGLLGVPAVQAAFPRVDDRISPRVGGPRGTPASPDGAHVDYAPVEAGVEAEICVKSPGVMQGYYKNPEATRSVLSQDGWLRTGDLGFVDAEGYLYVTGRLKDLIILGGQNVVPANIEEIVDRVDGVRYSAAVGIENERTGSQRLHVVAEVREPAAPPEAMSPPGP